MHLLSYLTNKTKENPLLTLILFVGFFLRMVATAPGYYYPIGDELLYSQAIHMIINRTLSFEAPYFGFPPLIPWIMLPVFALVFIPIRLIGVFISQMALTYQYSFVAVVVASILALQIKRVFNLPPAKFLKICFLLVWTALIVIGVIGITNYPILQREILGKNWITALYWGRYLTAFIGTLVILLTYKVANTYFESRMVALLAAFFVSVNYRMVLSSHIGLPDMYNVLFLLIALLAIGKLFNKSNFGVYLIAFLSMASFFMIKYQTHVFIPFLITHTAISIKGTKKSFSKFLRNFVSRKVFLPALIGTLFIVIAHFYHFRNWERVLEINHYEAIKYGFGRNILDLYPAGYLYNVGIGPSVTVLSIIGIIYGLFSKKYRLPTVVLISVLPTFAYLYMYYTNGGTYTRNVISTIPIFLIFAALFAFDIYKVIKKRNLLSPSLVALAFILSVGYILKDNIVNSAVVARHYSQPAPRMRAQEWVDQNITENDVTFGAFLGTTWPANPNVKAENLLPYYKAFSYQEMLEEKYDIVSIELSHLRDQYVWWTRQTPRIQSVFWNKPDDLLSQNFYSLAFRENIWRGGQAMFISPWQAPSHNFAIVKIDKSRLSDSIFTLKIKYSSLAGWRPLYFTPNYDLNPQEMFTNDGEATLIIKQARVLQGSVRYQSGIFEVKPNHIYKIRAKMMNTIAIPIEERDGFMRFDLFDQQPEIDVLTRSSISFVSKRIHGQPDWQEIEITGVAPTTAKYATLGFQYEGTAKSNFLLKDVEVYESKEVVKESGKHLTISDEELFLPNNDGVL